MFARIEEFATHAKGQLIVDSVSAGLESFERGEIVDFDYDWLENRLVESEKVLSDGVKKCGS